MKTMKNTMRKQSPLKFAELSTPEGKAASYGASRSKKAAPRGPLARAKAKAETSIKTKAPAAKPSTETSIKTTTPKPNPAGKPTSKTETSVKAPTMQLKKAGMKKKC